MAKSNGFFSLRRGSTKSLTFSVLNGRQITKDRVSQVRNPRTQRQQYQRAIMATVMAAYSRMKAIEDHAFEGASGKAANQQRFMSANSRLLRSLLATSLVDNDVKMVALAPKYPTVLPNPYVISEGSLPSQTVFTYAPAAGNTRAFLNLNETALTSLVTGRKSVQASEVANALGITPGLQITFVLINFAGGSALYPGTGQTGDKYGNFDFAYSRLCFQKHFESSEINFGEEDDNRAKAMIAVAGMFDNFADGENTTPAIYDRIADNSHISASGENWGYAAEDLVPEFDDSTTQAFGIITSVVDTDLRDNAVMVANLDSASNSIGLHPQYILDAWQGQGLIIGDSDKYLEGGDD